MPSSAPDVGVPFFDRDQARAEVRRWFDIDLSEQILDRLAGCVRPVAGAVLTPEDIPRVVYALRNQDHTSEADWQLAARLEAAL